MCMYIGTNRTNYLSKKLKKTPARLILPEKMYTNFKKKKNIKESQ